MNPSNQWTLFRDSSQQYISDYSVSDYAATLDFHYFFFLSRLTDGDSRGFCSVASKSRLGCHFKGVLRNIGHGGRTNCKNEQTKMCFHSLGTPSNLRGHGLQVGTPSAHACLPNSGVRCLLAAYGRCNLPFPPPLSSRPLPSPLPPLSSLPIFSTLPCPSPL